MLVARLAHHLLDLDRQIKDADKLITSRFRAHPGYDGESGIWRRSCSHLQSHTSPGGDHRVVARARADPRRGVRRGHSAEAWPGPPRPAVWPPTPASCPSPRTPTGHWEPAPPQALQPQTAPGVLHGGLIQPPSQRTISDLLRPQTPRADDPHSGSDRPRPPLGRRPVGTATRRPNVHTDRSTARYRSGLTRSFRFPVSGFRRRPRCR